MPERLPKEKPHEMPRDVWKQVKLLGHAGYGFRWGAAMALGRIGHESAVPHLIKALEDKNVHPRYIVAEALGEIGHASAVPHLAKLLEDESAVPYTVKALEDKKREVRWQAALSLGKIGRRLVGKKVEGKEAKALVLVARHFRENENGVVVRRAFLEALKGRVNEKNAELTVKQLRALKGKVK